MAITIFKGIHQSSTIMQNRSGFFYILCWNYISDTVYKSIIGILSFCLWITFNSICIRKNSELYNVIREFYYADIVHGHHVKSMFITILLNIFFRKPTVYTIHCSSKHLSKFNLFCFNFILRFTDRLVFVNIILYEELTLKQKGKIIDKYEVILNGVELNMNY